MIHLYAFVDDLPTPPDATGLDDMPLEAVAVDDVVAITSRRAVERSEPDREDVVRHGHVVEVLVDVASSVLPVRFGEEFADEDALREAVAARLPELRARLERVAGHVEVGVRVVERASGAVGPPAGDGVGYMREKLAALGRQDALVAQLREPLERRAASHRRSPPLLPGTLHAAAYLVQRDDLDAVTAVVERFVESHPELTVVCTGPWAPYSFVEAP